MSGDFVLGLFDSGTAPSGSTLSTALGTAALRAGGLAGDLLLSRLAAGGSGARGGAGATLAGAEAGPVQLAALGDSSTLAGMAAALDDAPAAMESLGGWFQAYGSLGALEGEGGTPGFETQAGGFLAGLDRPLGDGFFAGLAVGYSHTALEESGANGGSLDSPRVAAYGGWQAPGLVLGGSLGYGYHFTSYDRPVAATGRTAEARYGAHELTAAAQASSPLRFGSVTLQPRAGLQYLRLLEDGFEEGEAGSFSHSLDARTASSLRPFAALGLAYELGGEDGLRATPSLEVGYSRELLDAAPSRSLELGGGSFSVPALEPARDRVTLGGGLSLQLDETLEVNAGYRAELPLGNAFEQSFEAGLLFRF